MVQTESGSAVCLWKRESCWRKMRAVLPFVFQKRELLARSESTLSLSKAKLITVEHGCHIDGNHYIEFCTDSMKVVWMRC